MDRSAPLRVLVVDDNPQDRAEAKAALLRGSPRPYLFSEAASAEQGLLACQQLPPPDCVLLDLGLPDAGELDLLARLPRDADGLLGVAVVVLTGTLQPGRNQAALQAGAQDYVGKAWLSPEALTKAVENAIERLQLNRDLQLERHRAAAALADAQRLEGDNQRIEAAHRMKSQFLANISHELRTPLAAIVGFSDLLHRGHVTPDTPLHARFQARINSSAHHLLRLVDDLLDLAGIESGRLQIVPQPLDLGAVTAEVLDILSTESQRKRIHIGTAIAATLQGLVLDPTRLRQVLFNYLSNAIKFTPDGGRVRVRARPAGDRRFRLQVHDTGIGIAAADLPRLFADFQQLDTGLARQFQGAGLGLALTRRLVEAQGGSVGVSSRPGRGSVFWVELDRVSPSVAAGP